MIVIPIAGTLCKDFVAKLLWASAKIVLNKSHEHLDLSFRQHIPEWNHSVAAVGDVAEYLFVGSVFVFAVADVWDDAAIIEGFAHGFGAMTDGAILAEERGFIGFAVGDRVASEFLIRTAERKS